MAEQARKQAREIKRKPSPITGQVLPAGFEAHPERRHNGAWKKEDTARYKLEQMIKLDREALLEIANDDKAPVFERRIAKSLLQENNWKTTESMLNQVYGTPKQTMEVQQVDPKPLIDLTEVDEAEVKDDGKQPNDSAE